MTKPELDRAHANYLADCEERHKRHTFKMMFIRAQAMEAERKETLRYNAESADASVQYESLTKGETK